MKISFSFFGCFAYNRRALKISCILQLSRKLHNEMHGHRSSRTDLSYTQAAYVLKLKEVPPCSSVSSNMCAVWKRPANALRFKVKKRISSVSLVVLNWSGRYEDLAVCKFESIFHATLHNLHFNNMAQFVPRNLVSQVLDRVFSPLNLYALSALQVGVHLKANVL